MMYAFANRSDCYASDEPLYAHYLKATGINHPGAAEVIAHGQTDWRQVVAGLQAEVPDGSPVWYQKHMCQHIIEGVDLDWVAGMRHCFLIRQPREVLLSLSRKTDAIDAWATGLPQQGRIVAAVRERTGIAPLIVDAAQVLDHPERVLRHICAYLGIGFDTAMLRWEPGPKPCDGIWAKHWYQAVWASKGFVANRPRIGDLPPELMEVLQQVQPIYEALADQAIRP
jgi:hypothetical protein